MITWILWILGFASIAAVVIFWLWPQKKIDWWKSDFQPLHLPPEEKNKLSNGKDGYFSRPHAYRNFAIMVGSLIGGGVALQFYWLGSLLAVAGILAIFGALVKANNRQDIEEMETNRAAQAAQLTKIASKGASAVINPDSRLLESDNLRERRVFRFASFYDLVVDFEGDPDSFTVRQKASEDMWPTFDKLAAKSELWWSLDRSKV